MTGDAVGMGDRWDAVAGSYGSSPLIARLAEELVGLVGISPEDSVVDVGTGTGLALVKAAKAGGVQALGVDRSLGMLKAAAAAAERAGVANVSLVRADAAELPVPSGRADVVLAASVWQFVGYSAKALAEWRRVLRPGGRLGLSVPGPGSNASVPGDLMTKYFASLASSAQEDFVARASKSRPLPDLAEAMDAAGFCDVAVAERSWDDTLAGPEEWWAIQWTHAVRFFLQALEPEALRALREEAFQRLTRTDSGRVAITTKFLYAVGRR